MRELRNKYGIPTDDEFLAPGDGGETVDDVLVRGYYEQALSPGDDERVEYLIAHFRDWHDASRRWIAAAPAEDDLPLLRTGGLWDRRRMLGAAAVLALAAGLMFVLVWSGEHGEGFRDGDLQVALRENKLTGLENYGPVWRSRAAEALEDGISKPAAYERLQNELPILRSTEAEISSAIVSPYLTVVREQQPELRWAPLSGAESYRVELFEQGNEEPLLVDELTDTQLRVPTRLNRGKTYHWQVYYLVGDTTLVAPKRNEKPAVFTVLDDASLQKLAEVEQELSGSKLLLGLLYAKEGLLDDAERQWQELQDENPDSKLVERLLDSLRSIRRAK